MSAPLTFDAVEAAERLGGPFTVDWLKRRVRLRQIPHGKVGTGRGRSGRVFFTEEHLAEIVRMFDQPPAGQRTAAAPCPPPAVVVTGEFTPVGRRRSVS